MNETSPARPRIALLTQNCFSQCDIPLLSGLAQAADLQWNVFFPRDDKVGNDEAALERIGAEKGIPTRIWRFDERLRSRQAWSRFGEILDCIRAFQPDTLYVNAVGLPWLAPQVRRRFAPSRVVWAIHDVRDHRFNRFYHMQTLYRHFLYNAFQRFHFLSSNQRELFQRLYPGKTTYHAPHPPLDFGPRVGEAPEHETRFLFFGYVAPRKGVDVLIEAAELLHSRGVGGFKVRIAGKCSDWAPYQNRIRHPELFDLDIRLVPNETVVDLYSTSHWLVMPYRDITQSGPMSLAYHYNLPTITTDLPGFGEFVRQDETGFVFPLDSVEGLADAMDKALDRNRLQDMRRAQSAFYERHFSLPSCLRQYSEFLLPKKGDLPK